MTSSPRLFSLLLLLLTLTTQAQVPQLINYQGRVAARGVAFDGAGQFKFALVDAAGTVSYWSNDGTSNAGSEPAASVMLTVFNGSYSVLLGDASLPNMMAVPADVFANAGLHLRVWFNDGTNGSQLLSPDAAIAAPVVPGNVRVPRGNGGAAVPTDSWQNRSSTSPLVARHFHTSVWTGTEMIVWGGYDGTGDRNDGARYNPAVNGWTPMSNAAAPAARSGHTAVWTGSAMIVWGGNTGNTRFNSGACYFPETDTWTPLSTASAPAARWSHTAVWSGTEMIVWGGTGSESYNNGGRYSPQTDSWTAVALTNAPVDRYNHTAVWTGTQMIVWGGLNFDGYQDTGGRYTPATNSWAAVSLTGAPTGRYQHTAVWTGSQMIVWGGFNGLLESAYFNGGGRYNPAADTWSAVTATGAPQARFQHTAVWTGSEMVVWGGDGDTGVPVQSGSRYNPTANTWAALNTAGAPAARKLHTAVWTGSRIIVWGGLGASEFNDGGRFDPAGNMWADSLPVSAPGPRLWHKAVWTGSEMIVWGGGDNESFGMRANTGGRYNPTTNAWQATTSVGAPSPRVYHTAIWTGSEMIIWGGEGPGEFTRGLRDGGRYDPVLDSWTATRLPGAPAARENHTAVWTGSSMIVWGGSGEAGYLNDGALYDPVADRWQTMVLSGAPVARMAHSAVWTGSRMLVWGGFTSIRINEHPFLFDDEKTYDTGGSYNPVQDSWSGINGFGAPRSRKEHTAVWTGMEMIVWGGVSVTTNLNNNIITRTVLNDGARYNPTTGIWTPLATAQAPLRRGYHTAVWTGKEMVVWGGLDGIQFGGTAIWRGDGGRYSPATNTWSATTPAGAAPARFSHTSVWTGSEMLVFGGLGQARVVFNDIWSYNPGNLALPAALDITSSVTSDGLQTIRFTTELGRNYTLWRSDTLAAGSWINTGLSALSGTGARLEFTVSAPSSLARRFYRVQSQTP